MNGELQSEFSQLKDLMMAIINKSNSDSPSTSSQGLLKRPQEGLDRNSVLKLYIIQNQSMPNTYRQFSRQPEWKITLRKIFRVPQFAKKYILKLVLAFS